MINSIIVDDEPGNVRVLRKMLEDYCTDILVAGEAGNADEAEKVIQRIQPDLVFLDIEMPYGNAFDLLDRLMPVNFEVIFVTAFSDHMLKAFKYSALDYLLKPINIEELRQAVVKAADRSRLKSMNDHLRHFINNFSKPGANEYTLALPCADGLQFVRMNLISRCEANKGYTCFYLTNGEKILSTRNIKDYEDILPPSTFIRVHNSHIINLQFIRKYHKGRGGYIEMEDKTMIEVASRRKVEFLARFGV